MTKKADEKNLRNWLIDNNHVQNLQGKPYVLLSGLLALSHEHGLNTIKTTPTHIDIEKGEAVFSCEVSGDRGTFTGHGDAFADKPRNNVGRQVASAFIRMAETRSVCRALRFYLGIGMTARDELPGSSNEGDPNDGYNEEPTGRREDVGRGSAPNVGTGEIMDRIREECEAQGLSFSLVEEFYNAKKGVELKDVDPQDANTFLGYIKGRRRAPIPSLENYIEMAQRAEEEMKEANK